MATLRKTRAQKARERHYVKVARRRGCRAGLARIIIKWARVYGVPISLAFALIEHEAGFRKVFGHDRTIFVGAGVVTRALCRAYVIARRRSGNRLMQGVGEGQLTWWETQDLAEKLGGLHTADANVRVALLTLAARIHEHGEAKGVERYNGTGPAAVAYSREVRAGGHVWHRLLD
jgi:hypothetical protein